jgi:hypothetical protein
VRSIYKGIAQQFNKALQYVLPDVDPVRFRYNVAELKINGIRLRTIDHGYIEIRNSHDTELFFDTLQSTCLELYDAAVVHGMQEAGYELSEKKEDVFCFVKPNDSGNKHVEVERYDCSKDNAEAIFYTVRRYIEGAEKERAAQQLAAKKHAAAVAKNANLMSSACGEWNNHQSRIAELQQTFGYRVQSNGHQSLQPPTKEYGLSEFDVLQQPTENNARRMNFLMQRAQGELKKCKNLEEKHKNLLIRAEQHGTIADDVWKPAQSPKKPVTIQYIANYAGHETSLLTKECEDAIERLLPPEQKVRGTKSHTGQGESLAL